jgi:hypothetical protein
LKSQETPQSATGDNNSIPFGFPEIQHPSTSSLLGTLGFSSRPGWSFISHASSDEVFAFPGEKMNHERGGKGKRIPFFKSAEEYTRNRGVQQ